MEEKIMNIIAYSGECRSLVYESIELFKKKNKKGAREKLKEANEMSNNAHDVQSKILFSEANGEKVDLNVLLIHSQDHLMCSTLAMEMTEKFFDIIEVYEKN